MGFLNGWFRQDGQQETPPRRAAPRRSSSRPADNKSDAGDWTAFDFAQPFDLPEDPADGPVPEDISPLRSYRSEPAFFDDSAMGADALLETGDSVSDAIQDFVHGRPNNR